MKNMAEIPTKEDKINI